ncbi:MAG: hypothetical protein LC659_08275, partial [Myxococcales bacterium]|nr:hypothetical protein [Myxococcales bacterium]
MVRQSEKSTVVGPSPSRYSRRIGKPFSLSIHSVSGSPPAALISTRQVRRPSIVPKPRKRERSGCFKNAPLS